MALNITLKPGESFIINGTLIRNGNKAGKLTILTPCRMLRETEIIREEEVDTPCKQLWMTMQVIHLSEDPQEAYALLLRQVSEVVSEMPSAALYIAAMLEALDQKLTHKALKEVKQLVWHEQELLDRQREQAIMA